MKCSDNSEFSLSTCNEQDDNASFSDEYEDGEDITNSTEHQSVRGRHIVELEVLANALDNGYVDNYIIYL